MNPVCVLWQQPHDKSDPSGLDGGDVAVGVGIGLVVTIVVIGAELASGGLLTPVLIGYWFAYGGMVSIIGAPGSGMVRRTSDPLGSGATCANIVMNIAMCADMAAEGMTSIPGGGGGNRIGGGGGGGGGSEPGNPGDQIPGGARSICPADGPAIEIPRGYVGRVGDKNTGQVWQLPGSIGNNNSIRIMDPTPMYPKGYIVIHYGSGNKIDVSTGKPGIGRANQHWHNTWSASN